MWQSKWSAINLFLSVDALLRIYLEPLGGRLSTVKYWSTTCQLPCVSFRILSGSSTLRVIWGQFNQRAQWNKQTTKKTTTYKVWAGCDRSMRGGAGLWGRTWRGRLLAEGPRWPPQRNTQPTLILFPTSGLQPTPPILSPSKVNGNTALWQSPYGPSWPVVLQRQTRNAQHTLLSLRERIKMEASVNVQQLGNESIKWGMFCCGCYMAI